MGSSDGGCLDMDTDAVVRHLAELADLADGLGTAWSGTAGQLGARRPGIANDLLGHVFHRAYDPDETRAREQADRVPPALRASAQVGEQCAYFYRAADANGHAAMPSAGVPDGPR